jgi:hypothetical protein
MRAWALWGMVWAGCTAEEVREIGPRVRISEGAAQGPKPESLHASTEVAVARAGSLAAELREDGVTLGGPGLAPLRLRSSTGGPATPPNLRLGRCEASLPHPCDQRAERSLSDGITEWWYPHAGGLHQGWTVTPGGASGDDEVVIRVTAGDGHWEADGDDGWLIVAPEGTWTWRGLAAFDGAGEPAEVMAWPDGDGMEIILSPHGQPGPWVIDPIVRPPPDYSDQIYSRSSYSFWVSGGGDLNLDGYNDAVCTGQGLLNVAGSADGHWSLIDDNISASFAASAVQADLNGDGYQDIAADWYFPTGAVGIFWGGPNGTNHREQLFATVGTFDGAGTALAAGDIDGDGRADLAVSTTGLWTNSPTPASGWVDVWRGTPTGPSPVPWPRVSSRGTSGSWYGEYVDLNGDLNGDGRADLVISNPGCAFPLSDGSLSDAFVHLGTTSGPAIAASWTWREHAPDDQCVLRVASAPDLNGDGYDDLTVSGTTEAWVVLGGPTGPAGAPISLGERPSFGYAAHTAPGWVWAAGLGDVNDDGFGDLIYAYADTLDVHLGGPDGVLADPIWRLDVPSDHDGRRGFGAGDMNADGIGDIFAGAPWASNGLYQYSGMAGIWLGEPVADIDQDGYLNQDDCQPYRSWAHAGAAEVPGNAVDDNCDGILACFTDQDGDGYGGSITVTVPVAVGSCTAAGYHARADDCWDGDPSLGPQATEIAEDDVDQNCDGLVLCLIDHDGDGFGGTAPVPVPATGCSAVSNHDTDRLDCDDNRAATAPSAPEVPSNGFEDNCDGVFGCAPDADGDGYGSDDGVLWVPSPDLSCNHPGMSTRTDDCADADPAIHPRATELAEDGVDQNCDGRERCWVDFDGDGYGGQTDSTWPTCTHHPNPYVVSGISGGDCNDASALTSPSGVEVMDGSSQDEDCNGFVDCYTGDRDGDGYGGQGDTFLRDARPAGDYCPSYYGVKNGDCSPDDPTIHPFPTPRILGVDEDCDGYITCAIDADGDGHGTQAVEWSAGALSCSDPFLSLDRLDCDDTRPDVFEGAAEVAGDDVDQDCDGSLACWRDDDQDGYGAVLVTAQVSRCTLPGLASQPGDCDDQERRVSPGKRELPGNGFDEDCDGLDTFSLIVTPRPVVSGQPMQIEIHGATPGATVWVARSTRGPGAGPCPPAMGGGCLGITQPTLALTRRADALGRVTVQVPAAPAVRMWLQAWTLNPTGVGQGTAVVAMP